MANFILQDENAVYYECGYSCDNEIFINAGDERFFITDARYGIEAKSCLKNTHLIVAQGSLIKEGYSIELDELKSIRKNGKDFIAQFENDEREKLITLFDDMFVKSGVTCLIATTSEEIANRLCSRTIKFNNGQVED